MLTDPLLVWHETELWSVHAESMGPTFVTRIRWTCIAMNRKQRVSKCLVETGGKCIFNDWLTSNSRPRSRLILASHLSRSALFWGRRWKLAVEFSCRVLQAGTQQHGMMAVWVSPLSSAWHHASFWFPTGNGELQDGDFVRIVNCLKQCWTFSLKHIWRWVNITCVLSYSRSTWQAQLVSCWKLWLLESMGVLRLENNDKGRLRITDPLFEATNHTSYASLDPFYWFLLLNLTRVTQRSSFSTWGPFY